MLCIIAKKTCEKYLKEYMNLTRNSVATVFHQEAWKSNNFYFKRFDSTDTKRSVSGLFI